MVSHQKAFQVSTNPGEACLASWLELRITIIVRAGREIETEYVLLHLLLLLLLLHLLLLLLLLLPLLLLSLLYYIVQQNNIKN